MADFFELLERLPNEARDAIDAIIAMDGPTLADVRRLVRDHKAPEHVVVALFGFLPDAKGKGELVNAYCTTATSTSWTRRTRRRGSFIGWRPAPPPTSSGASSDDR